MMTQEQQLACFGTTLESLNNMINEPLFDKVMTPMSILSDCQEMLMAYGEADPTAERIRKALNVAKWVISKTNK